MQREEDDQATPRRRRKAGQARMEDVARLAGVSMITVSRALHQPQIVSESTRRQIADAMRTLGYVPNLVAGGLASTRSRTVAAIVPFVRDGVFADTIQGLADSLRPHGFSVLLGSSGTALAEEERLVRHLLGHRPAGFVLHGGSHSEETRRLLQNADIPIVETGVLPEQPVDMVVGYSNFAAARSITQLLLGRGCRRIGFVSADPTINDRAAERLRGHQSALIERGVVARPELEIQTTFGMAEGRLALVELLGREPRLDAVFFTSDIWAAAALLECARRGIDVPGRLAIAGFNDQEIACEILPSLTTVRVRRYAMGEVAARLILDRLEERPCRAMVDVGFELISRNTA
jgi:LacI family transcriptional regulator, gluconate utilization system Gnt-I transcriptional repressor